MWKWLYDKPQVNTLSCRIGIHSWNTLPLRPGMGKRGKVGLRCCSGCGRMEVRTADFWGGGWGLLTHILPEDMHLPDKEFTAKYIISDDSHEPVTTPPSAAPVLAATRGEMLTLPLYPAYVWDCEHCGRENFQRAISQVLNPDNDDDARVMRTFRGIDDGEELPDGVGMVVTTIPHLVTCKHCQSQFRAMEPSPRDDDEDDGE